MKKIVAAALGISMALSLSACSSNEASDSSQIAELEERIQELEEENADLKEQLGETDIADTSDDEENNSVDTDEVQAAEVGVPYTIPDLCEFTVNYAELKKEVLPPNPASFYNYYPEEDGMTYLDVAVSVKNLRTTARVADEFGTAKAIVGDGYEYDGFSTIEESGGSDFGYTNITNINPLETAVIHYIISIPNEVADDAAAPISVEITMLDQDYTISVR